MRPVSVWKRFCKADQKLWPADAALAHPPVSHRVSNPEGEDDYEDLAESVRLVKQVIAVVDSKVNEHEKRRRLKEFHARMDSKSIMMMKSGQMFAKEDLLRRRLIHDGVLHLKSSQGRLKGEPTPTG